MEKYTISKMFKVPLAKYPEYGQSSQSYDHHEIQLEVTRREPHPSYKILDHFIVVIQAGFVREDNSGGWSGVRREVLATPLEAYKFMCEESTDLHTDAHLLITRAFQVRDFLNKI